MVTGAYQAAIQSLWTGRAALIVREGVPNETTGRTELKEVTRQADIPCRVSYETVKPTETVEMAAQTVQAVTLFCAPELEIPEGTKLVVTQNGVTREYERSGTPAVYTCHQEVPLELFRGWA